METMDKFVVAGVCFWAVVVAGICVWMVSEVIDILMKANWIGGL